MIIGTWQKYTVYFNLLEYGHSLYMARALTIGNIFPNADIVLLNFFLSNSNLISCKVLVGIFSPTSPPFIYLSDATKVHASQLTNQVHRNHITPLSPLILK